jgi:hypothetical protein
MRRKEAGNVYNLMKITNESWEVLHEEGTLTRVSYKMR